MNLEPGKTMWVRRPNATRIMATVINYPGPKHNFVW